MKKSLMITTLIILIITIIGCSPQEYEVNIELAPEDSGEVVGEGAYEAGEEVELAAIPNEGYEFENWTIDEEVISDDKIHKMPIDEDLNLTANFKRIKRNKFAYVNINDGVDVRIGPFFQREEISLKAETREGYEFLNWEIDGEKSSEEKEIEINVNERDIRVKTNYENLSNEVDELIEKADEAILNKNYNEAQEYLKEAIRNENIEKSKYYNNSNFLLYLNHSSNPLELIESINKDNIMTVKDYKENIKKYEDKKPEDSKIKILERDENEIYTWLKKCLNYTRSIRRNPLGWDFAESEVDDAVREVESKYFVNPEGITWLFSEIKLIEGKVYVAGGKDEVGMPTKLFELLEKLDLKEIDVSQDRVIISIERPSEDTLIGLYNDGGSPYIESCDIVFEINRYEDGSFKIKDYYPENMITFED
jgi:hypothetical protein